MRRAALAGWGAAVPRGRLTNHDLAATLDTSDEWIVSRTGIRERRVACEGETTATLAVEAGRAALATAERDPGDVDLLVIATCTPEQPIPHTGAFVGDELSVSCGSFDLNAGCAGFVYALVVAAGLLEAGRAGRVLVIGAETLSRVTDPCDRATGILFGDAAAAVVLEAGAPDGPGLLAWDLGCDGSAADLLGVPAGGSRRPASAATVEAGLHSIKMTGREVFRRAVRAVVETSTTTLGRAGVASSEVAWFLPHQANGRIIDVAAQRLGISRERTIVNLEHYGNTSAASVPLALSEAADGARFAPGDLLLLAGFGAGMTWSSALLRWGRP